MTEQYFIAIDLGASNGRVIVGAFRHGRLSPRVAHRFNHGLTERDGKKRWDWPLLTAEVDKGLALAAAQAGQERIMGVSCGSWAQDFGLLDQEGKLFYPPVSYRDARTAGMPENFADIIAPSELLRRNGSCLSPVTTLCQLRAMALEEPAALSRASTLLFVADLIHHHLCGACVTDATFATASHARRLAAGAWDNELLEQLGVPAAIMPAIAVGSTIVGRIPVDRAPHPNLVGVPVINGAGHDTAAAAGAIQPFPVGTLFVSLGTWAMLGCHVEAGNVPGYLRMDSSLAALGLLWGRWGLFKSGAGLWACQECAKAWRRGDWGALDEAAAQGVIDTAIDLAAPRFFAPTRPMPEEIRAACAETGQTPPRTPGETVRVIYRSLAKSVKQSVDVLRAVTGMRFTGIHALGGGSRSGLLRGLIAAELGIPVLAGSPEATAVGNILNQMKTLGVLKTEEELETVVDNLNLEPEP